MLDAIKTVLGGYINIRDNYRGVVYYDIYGYLTGDAAITNYKNDMKAAMREAFQGAAQEGYQDGMAELPLDEDTQGWLDERMAQESANIDALFTSERQLKKENDVDAQGEADERADGYAASLDDVYNIAKIHAAGNQMLEFDGEDGAESCPTCQKLKGQRHKASWWLAHDLIPYRGNSNLACGGWQCQHYLKDDNGNLFTF